MGAELSVKSDLLNERLEGAANELRSYGFGVEAFVDISTEDDREHDWAERLWFRRWNTGDWNLVLESGFTGDSNPEDDPPSYELLRNTTRETRLRAALRMKDLLAALVKAATPQREELDAALAALETFQKGVG